MQIYVHRDGKEYGPFSLEDVAEQVRTGTLVPHDLAWYEGCAQWIPLSSVTGFSSRPVFPPPPLQAHRDVAVSRPRQSDVLGYVLLGISAAAALMIWRAAELGFPPLITALATVVTMGVLVGIEAKRLGVGSATDLTPKGNKRSGPFMWAAFVILFWAIGFPAYLYWRSRYGARNLVIPAIVMVIAFLAAPYVPGSKVGMEQLQTWANSEDDSDTPSDPEAEADKLFKANFAPYNGTWINKGDFTKWHYFVQLKGLKPNIISHEVSEADKLNGLMWDGSIGWTADAFRLISVNKKPDGEDAYEVKPWDVPSLPSVLYAAQFRNGQWQVQEIGVGPWQANVTMRPTEDELRKFKDLLR